MSLKRKLSEKEKKCVSCSQDWKCGHCKNLLPSSYQIDHIIPFSICHNDNIDNLMALCPTCHANKSQVEYNRILQYKKLKAQNNFDYLCWFCLNNIEEHKCNRELKEIKKEIPKYKLNSNINSLDKFNFTTNMNSTLHIINDMNKLNLDSILHIKLRNSLIFVNSFFTPSTTFSIEEIAKAVSIATRTKKDSKRYDEVEITIELENIDKNKENEMIDFLNDNLPSLLPNRIFKNDEISYTYLI